MSVASSAWDARSTIADEAVAPDLAPIFARAKAARLAGFEVSVSHGEKYVGIGDAPAPFREKALEICEKLAGVYGDYFQAKGFKTLTPEHRLILIILKNKDSYRKYLGAGAEVGVDVGGHYDVEANQLVVFDTRDNDDGGAASARVNTFTLVHEAIHQLTFNTGLLERRGDVPVAISEGLATFGELWQHTNQRSTLGVRNSVRLGVFLEPNGLAPWIPAETLLTDDDVFGRTETSQVAYAESWVLVHYFLRTPAKLPKFRAYLDAIRKRTDPAHRLDDARAHLGDLARLDKDLRLYRNKSIQS